jgi:tRNA(Ile2) C34 agmatinyltransferase TiaS
MSAAVMDAPATLFTSDRRRTLEDLLEVSWRRAHVDGATECPVCAETMHAAGAQANCSNCGTTLA